MLTYVIKSVKKNTVTKNEIILTQEAFSKMKQKETEMSSSIEDLKARCTCVQELNNTIRQFSNKVSNLETQINQYIVLTEQQLQVIDNT
ncbi:hypothetical protein PIROE2DRAFT_9096 [Piromyces sp. E2]|nr:hypothetical protein PIROE2DRAFT_9096 [Piromyces sp. E2]|eukprot:OUM64194.1 hypothetical protein PIROE2DRAFT_9096 [Piromyces sp. E2]